MGRAPPTRRGRYDPWADIYDQVYADLGHDLGFYLQLALAAHGPVLELGAGTGRVALTLAQHGVHVTGVDSSPYMVALAQRKARAMLLGARARFVLGDMRRLRLPARFALVVMPFRSLQALVTPADQQAALSTAAFHLRPAGVLAFAVANLDVRALAADDGSRMHVHDVTDPATGRVWRVWGRNRWDPATRVNHVRLSLEERERGGRLLRRAQRSYPLRQVTRRDAGRLLRDVGLEMTAVYGGFDGEPQGAAGDDMVVVARKPAG